MAKFRLLNLWLQKKLKTFSDTRIKNFHIDVARKLAERNNTDITNVGKRVPYVICKATKANEDLNVTERAEHPDDVEKDENLEIDYRHYITNSLGPPLIRLGRIISVDVQTLLQNDAREYIDDYRKTELKSTVHQSATW